MLRHALALVGVLGIGLPALAQNQLWIEQFGTSWDEEILAAAPDGSGGVFVGGYTRGDLAGSNPGLGAKDAWLSRYDGSGHRSWILQLGTTSDDGVQAVAFDGVSGLFVGGFTYGALANQHAGNKDMWLGHVSSNGVWDWMVQEGTSANDHLEAVASDGVGGMYVAGGDSGGPLVARYDSSGSQIWKVHWTDYSDVAVATAAVEDGSGGVYVGGADEWSAYLARYDGLGNELWSREVFYSGFGEDVDDWTSFDSAALDRQGNVLFGIYHLELPHFDGPSEDYTALSGTSLGCFGPGGNELWFIEQTPGSELTVSDGADGAYSGGTNNPYPFVKGVGRYSAAGMEIWNEASIAYGHAGASDGFSGLFVGGSTLGSLGGPNAGGLDVVLGRYDAAGETYCTAGTTANGCTAQVSSSGTPSRSASAGFLVDVNTVEGDKDGMFFFSANGRQANPWGNGTSYQCVVPPVQRTPLQVGTGTPGACDGYFQVDFNAWMAANPTKAPQAGGEANMQCWFRDPLNTSNQTTSMSNALEFFVNP